MSSSTSNDEPFVLEDPEPASPPDGPGTVVCLRCPCGACFYGRGGIGRTRLAPAQKEAMDRYWKHKRVCREYSRKRRGG